MDIQNEKIKNEIFQILPAKIYGMLKDIDFSDLREIRLRTNGQVMLYFGNETKTLGNPLSADNISEVFNSICKNSVYAYLNEICNGFITLPGGHRVGISGECVISGNEITNIHNLSGINIRIAREFKGCAFPIISHIKTAHEIKNTILISPPACGKTTMLRDIARIISARNKVTVIDERSEICGAFRGTPQFDVGTQTDVITKSPKTLGIIMALRALSPDVIITDEVGTKNDIEAIEEILGAGCKIITSIHGYSAESIKKSKGRLLSHFDLAIELTKRNGIPEIANIINMEEFTYD